MISSPSQSFHSIPFPHQNIYAKPMQQHTSDLKDESLSQLLIQPSVFSPYTKQSSNECEISQEISNAALIKSPEEVFLIEIFEESNFIIQKIKEISENYENIKFIRSKINSNKDNIELIKDKIYINECDIQSYEEEIAASKDNIKYIKYINDKIILHEHSLEFLKKVIEFYEEEIQSREEEIEFIEGLVDSSLNEIELAQENISRLKDNFFKLSKNLILSPLVYFMNCMKLYFYIRNIFDHEKSIINNLNQDYIETLRILLPLAQDLYHSYKIKLTHQIKKEKDEFQKTNIKEYIKKIEIISLKTFLLINPKIYAEIYSFSSKKEAIIFTFNLIRHCQSSIEKLEQEKNKVHAKILANYIDWLDVIFFDIYELRQNKKLDNLSLLFTISPSEMDLERVILLKKMINKYLPRTYSIAENHLNNKIKSIKDKSLAIFGIEKKDIKNTGTPGINKKIENNYHTLKFQLHHNPARIRYDFNRRKDHEKDIEDLNQTLRNIKFMQKTYQKSSSNNIINIVTQDLNNEIALKKSLAQHQQISNISSLV